MNDNRRQNSESWSEFDWERILRESDNYARRYFQLLERFGDLPAAGELINSYLEPHLEGEGCDFDCNQCGDRWNCDISMANEWKTDADLDFEDEESLWEESEWEVEESKDNSGSYSSSEPGDPFFYESDLRFKTLRQVVLGWCNVYAAILPPASRTAGLRILFHLGRALGNLSYSIGDGLYDRPAASTAFAKRSLAHLNTALGMLNRLFEDKSSLAPLLGAIKKHIMEGRTMVFDHLRECRNRNDKA